jgi:hypothetical protein
MLTTEEEAKTKWCPEVRTGLVAGMAVNYHIGGTMGGPHAGEVHEETRCVASGCMMWRWYDSAGRAPRRGFCGKAGAPMHQPGEP